MYLSYTQIIAMQPNLIKGKVCSSINQEPLPNAHIQVLYAQDAVLTNSEGLFVLPSWQAFPITLIVEHKGFYTSHINITKPVNHYTIVLKPIDVCN